LGCLLYYSLKFSVYFDRLKRKTMFKKKRKGSGKKIRTGVSQKSRAEKASQGKG
jgi:hypothetical protein